MNFWFCCVHAMHGSKLNQSFQFFKLTPHIPAFSTKANDDGNKWMDKSYIYYCFVCIVVRCGYKSGLRPLWWNVVRTRCGSILMKQMRSQTPTQVSGLTNLSPCSYLCTVSMTCGWCTKSWAYAVINGTPSSILINSQLYQPLVIPWVEPVYRTQMRSWNRLWFS